MTAKRKIKTALYVVVALALGGAPNAVGDAAVNRALVIDYLRMLFGEKKVAQAVETYAADNIVQHNPNIGDGREPIIAFLDGLMAAHPAATWEIKRVVAEGDLVVVHTHLTLSPDDRGMAVVDIFRVADGKVVEHWDVLQPVPAQAANDNTMF